MSPTASQPPGKLPGVGESIFSVMSRLALEHGAINLSQGYPDYDGPQLLRDRAAWHMNHGHNQYAPLAGVPELREAIAELVQARYGARIDPDREITVTPGATEALSCAIATLVHPGDEVLVLDPAYDSYDPCVRLNGGVPVHVPMRPDFRVDWDRVRAALTPRTRLLMLNHPHNPGGTVFGETDLAALRELVDGHPLYLVSDEVYEHIVFDGRPHRSLLGDPALASRAFVVSSFGKTFHATGWRVGYCIAPPALMAEFQRIHQFTNFSTQTPLQYAIADTLSELPEHLAGLGAFYQRRRDLFLRELEGSGFRFTPAEGSYFQLVDYSDISDAPDTAFAMTLTTDHGVAAIPVSVFQVEPPPGQRVVRFCFAKEESTLTAAGERLRAL